MIGVGILVMVLATPACSTATGTSPSAAATAWSSPTKIPPASPAAEASVYGISCPTDSLCTAVDENGAGHTWQDGRWSGTQPVPAGGSLTAVSCPTTTKCVAVSSGGNSAIYDGRFWSRAPAVGPAASYRISCPSAEFCAAVGDSGTPGGPNTVATFDGDSWSTSVLPSAGVSDRLFDVSCATNSFCVAIDLDGISLTYDGRTWSPHRAPALRGATSVSCPVRSFCMAVGPSAYSTFDGNGWSGPKSIPDFTSAFVPDVSCATPQRCTVVGLNGESVQWRSGAWSMRTSVFAGEFLATVAISCPTPQFCMTVNSRGTAAHT
jgi:hypothetical protein